MQNYCSRCKTILNLMPKPYSRSVGKSGKVYTAYMCRSCNTERAKRYRQTKVGREKVQKAVRKSTLKHLHKQQARNKVRQAMQQGLIERPVSCEDCNTNLKQLDAHHPDYTKPLEVVWLCRSCHATLHRL